MDQRASEAQFLLHAARQLARAPGGDVAHRGSGVPGDVLEHGELTGVDGLLPRVLGRRQGDLPQGPGEAMEVCG